MYRTARTAADGERTVEELAKEGVSVHYLLFDLAGAQSPQNLAQELRRRHGGIDVLVQNGAYMPRAGVRAADDARAMIAANNHGTLRVLRAFLPMLREKRPDRGRCQ